MSNEKDKSTVLASDIHLPGELLTPEKRKEIADRVVESSQNLKHYLDDKTYYKFKPDYYGHFFIPDLKFNFDKSKLPKSSNDGFKTASFNRDIFEYDNEVEAIIRSEINERIKQETEIINRTYPLLAEAAEKGLLWVMHKAGFNRDQMEEFLIYIEDLIDENKSRLKLPDAGDGN